MASVTTAANQLLLAALIVSCASTQDAPQSAGGAGLAGASEAGSGGEADHTNGASGTSGANAATGASGTGGAFTAGAGAADASAGEAGAGGEAGNDGRHALFNGVDFAGWDRYLGKPSDAEAALGIDNDPRGVYSILILEGEATLRISGEVWGSLISKREFCNFRLRAQFKWGRVVWTIKDSGIMFLSGGPLGAVNAGGNPLSDPIGSGAFVVSTEYQIAPNDVGTLYNLGPIAFTSSVHSVQPEAAEDWNDVEISLQDDVASLLLNGHEVSRASGFVLNWPDQPALALHCGKLQLQSEGAEIFFRRLEIEEFP